MNETFSKALNFASENFWDWQFFAFVLVAVLVSCIHFLDRRTPLKKNWFRDYVFTRPVESDFANYCLIGVVSILVVALLVAIVGIHIPQTHDEFGYLLAADTFRHLRLVNPTPVSPQHFEYFHILIEPVYAAKYPPLQGFFLAVGTVLTGFPAAGVWISSLLSNVALYWFLRSIFSPAWALFGLLLWVFSPLNFIWLDSYWGAHVAVIGGCLSSGAVFRFLKDGNVTNLFVWGVGIFLLANSRPFEGAVLTALLIVIWFFDAVNKTEFSRKLFRALAVLALMILINLAWLAFYNSSVTKDPFLLPYSLHHSQYHRVPLFVFQHPGGSKTEVPPVIKKLDERWTSELQEDYRDPISVMRSTLERIPIYVFWLTRSPFLLVLLLLGLFALRNEKDDFHGGKVIFVLAMFLAALFLTTFKGDRFTGAVVGLALVPTILAARMLYRKSGYWRPVVLALPLIIGAGFLAGTAAVEAKRIPLPVIEDQLSSRQQIVDFLTERGGAHLVFVETADANPADARFYVYNDAEMKEATIVWAHDLGVTRNASLISSFSDRQIWRLKNMDHKTVLTKYVTAD